MAKWWNGRHNGLKIRCWQQRVGSSPTFATILWKTKSNNSSTTSSRLFQFNCNMLTDSISTPFKSQLLAQEKHSSNFVSYKKKSIQIKNHLHSTRWWTANSLTLYEKDHTTRSIVLVDPVLDFHWIHSIWIVGLCSSSIQWSWDESIRQTDVWIPRTTSLKNISGSKIKVWTIFPKNVCR